MKQLQQTWEQMSFLICNCFVVFLGVGRVVQTAVIQLLRNTSHVWRLRLCGAAGVRETGLSWTDCTASEGVVLWRLLRGSVFTIREPFTYYCSQLSVVFQHDLFHRDHRRDL